MRRYFLIMFLLVFAASPLKVKGTTLLYSNAFDTLDNLIVDTGTPNGSVSIESGQLKLRGEIFNFRGAYVSIDHTQFSAPYTGKLVDLPDTISWSFNLSNMDEPGGGVNNGFEVHLVSSNVNPDASNQFSYFFHGGIFVGDRMTLRRGTHTNSPFGNDSKILIDIPSGQGLSPLPERGSFRIDYTPSSGLWKIHAEYGETYVDPRNVTNLLGTATDNRYINEFMPYFTLSGVNGGAVYVDNLTVEIIPEPTTAALLVSGIFCFILKRKHKKSKP